VLAFTDPEGDPISPIDYSTDANELFAFDIRNGLTSMGATAGQTPTAAIYTLDTWIPVSGLANPTMLTGTSIGLQLNGSVLAPREKYRLIIGWGCTSSADTMAQYLDLNILF
jgi:hypothetical protein